MRRKNILRGLLCAAVLLGAALVGAQGVSARETVLIAGSLALAVALVSSVVRTKR